MSEGIDDILEMLRQRLEANGKDSIRREDVEKLRQATGGLTLPAITVNQRAWLPSIPVPDIKPISTGRRDRALATDMRRDLMQISYQATKAGVAVQAVRSVNTYVVYSVDQAQEEMAEILYGRPRHEGMSELMASVISQVLQQMIAQMHTISEHHFKRQLEVL